MQQKNDDIYYFVSDIMCDGESDIQFFRLLYKVIAHFLNK